MRTISFRLFVANFSAFLISIAATISNAGESCDDPAFGAKFAVYAAVDTAGPGVPAMAMLAIAGGPQSSQYREIAKLAIARSAT